MQQNLALNSALFGFLVSAKLSFSFEKDPTLWKPLAVFVKIAIGQLLDQCYYVRLITAHRGFSWGITRHQHTIKNTSDVIRSASAFHNWSYDSALVNCGLPTLLARRDEVCRRFISNIKGSGRLPCTPPATDQECRSWVRVEVGFFPF